MQDTAVRPWPPPASPPHPTADRHHAPTTGALPTTVLPGLPGLPGLDPWAVEQEALAALVRRECRSLERLLPWAAVVTGAMSVVLMCFGWPLAAYLAWAVRRRARDLDLPLLEAGSQPHLVTRVHLVGRRADEIWWGVLLVGGLWAVVTALLGVFG